MTRPLALGAALLLLTPIAPAAARADDNRATVLDAPAPPTLPALAHRLPTYTFEYTAASIEPSLGSAFQGRAYAWFAHNELEVPFVPRKWYFGLASDVAAGAVPGVGHDVFLGNPEIWMRGLWSSYRGLSSGGGLGIVVPAPRVIGDDEERVLAVVSVVRPWDAAYFSNLTMTLRPWFDIRHVAGSFILQLRQGIDYSIVMRSLLANENRTDLVARATFYAGYRLAQPLGVGLEVWEVYQVTAPVADDQRAALAISPSVRFMLPNVEPALSLLLPISTPLKGAASSYLAARLSVGFEFDPHPRGPGS